MRVISILTHSTTLVWIQQIIIVWFVIDFFLARDSSAANKLFREHASRTGPANNLINQIETTATNLRRGFSCRDTVNATNTTYDKVIFIVIDAFGSEFVPSIERDFKLLSLNSSAKSSYRMPFIEQSLAENNAMGFIAKAATPTVTMPRIKSLVSGTIPSFVDIIHNLASDVSKFHDDNLLRLAWNQGKSLVFYGDDTWLALFDKSIFKRVRETLSLYASDYISVDTNVTEMALPETTRTPVDWDYLILHYLGLDHIGHVFGSNEAPLIYKKLLEMDNVIKKIYENMVQKQEKTLIVICGDHGMSREGNHGGDTRLESKTAMIFLTVNKEFHNSGLDNKLSFNNDRRVQQIDLAATLSLLTGLPIPSMSRGVVMVRLLQSLWSDDTSKLACALIDNLVQLSSLLDDSEFSSPNGLGNRILRLFQRMANNATADNTKSYIGQGFVLAQDIQTQLIRTIAAKSNPLLVMSVLAGVMFLSLVNIRKSCIRLLMPLMSPGEKFTCLCSLTLPITMLNSTDFIELEHTLWPIYAILVFVLFSIAALKQQQVRYVKQDLETHRAILFIITFMLTAIWNNVSFLSQQELGWSPPAISVLIMCNFSRQTSAIEGKQTLIFFGTGLLVFVTKMFEETSELSDSNLSSHSSNADHFTRVAALQIFAFVSLISVTVTNICTSFAKHDIQATSIVQKLATSWMWWIFLLTRSRNYVFLISNVIMEASLNSLVNSLRLSSISRAVIYLIFSSHAYFSQGNTNLFSSLDIKPAFFGQTRYNFVLAVPLIACATFGAQIYWYIKLFQRVQGEKEQERMVPSQTSETVAHSGLIPAGTKEAIKDFVDMRNFLTIGYYMFVCIVLRNHLFIWSVISPKLVYLFMTTLSLRVTTTVISNAPHLLDWTFHRQKSQTNPSIKYKRIIN